MTAGGELLCSPLPLSLCCWSRGCCDAASAARGGVFCLLEEGWAPAGSRYRKSQWVQPVQEASCLIDWDAHTPPHPPIAASLLPPLLVCFAGCTCATLFSPRFCCTSMLLSCTFVSDIHKDECVCVCEREAVRERER